MRRSLEAVTCIERGVPLVHKKGGKTVRECGCSSTVAAVPHEHAAGDVRR